MGSGCGQHGEGSSQTSRPIRLGNAILDAHRHVCAFFTSHDDQYRVLLPFIKNGFDGGEKAVHTHPVIIIGGILQENPFFVPPVEFIEELRERRARNGTLTPGP